MNNKKQSTFLFLLATIAWMLFVLSVSISVPLVLRPFYYAHIHAMEMPQKTGLTELEIREAFDEMMDFCILGKEFGTGVLPWSESGKAHFEDCAFLFRLDFVAVGVSIVILMICLVLEKRGRMPARPLGRGPKFWGGILLGAVFLLIAGVAAIDFDQAFVTFHHLFFPGKDNWIFYPSMDGIILILPEEFFRNCAILIVGVMVILCVALMIWDKKECAKHGIGLRDQL